MTLERQFALHCVETGKKKTGVLADIPYLSISSSIGTLTNTVGNFSIPREWAMGNLVNSVLLDVEDTVAELGVRSVSVHSPNQSFWSVQD